MIPLPIDPVLPEIAAALRERRAAVVVAPPGSGKTTRVPAGLLDAGLAGKGKVLVLQPRRVAARLSARRIAEERDGVVGDEIGYAVRFERKVSPRTRLEVITEGLLTRRLQQDPFLEDVGLVVLDELHERSLHVDLALALLREAADAGREDLKIVAMSATLDSGPIARFLWDAPVIRAEGRSFPVEIRHDLRADDRPAPLRVAEAARELLRAETEGHLLCFLPGQGEIRRALELLEDAARAGAPELQGVDLLPLHGSLSAEAQDRALMPTRRRKVVIATNIAETSVTLDGVRAVVDAGLARVPSFDPALGLDRLELQRISLASADQRAGRAGRTGPGICRRLWTVSEQRMFEAYELPEIARVDLAPALLEIHGWGADPDRFGWFERPPEASMRAADALLRQLEALDPRGGLSPLGRALLALPLHPRLGRVVVAGAEAGVLREAAAAAALASERDPWTGLDERGPPVDLETRVELLLSSPRAPGGADRGAWQAAREACEQIARVSPPSSRRRSADAADLARVLLSGFPDRVGRRRAAGSDRVRLATGAGAVLDHRGDPGTELILAVSLEASARRERAEQRVRLAAPLEAAWLPPGSVTRTRELSFDPERESVVGRTITRYGTLILDERPDHSPGDPAETARLLAQAALAAPERALNLDEDALQLQARIRFLRRSAPELELPDPDDLAALLPELCQGRRALSELRALDLGEALLARLSWPQRQTLDRMAPDRYPVPSGSTVRLDYPSEGPPVLAARIQQLFGMKQTPRLADGRVPVLVHLLAPNHRPVQVTADLASFWANTYALVRKDLRGRYPRHAWPDDPLTAIPEDRPRRRTPPAG